MYLQIIGFKNSVLRTLREQHAECSATLLGFLREPFCREQQDQASSPSHLLPALVIPTTRLPTRAPVKSNMMVIFALFWGESPCFHPTPKGPMTHKKAPGWQ